MNRRGFLATAAGSPLAALPLRSSPAVPRPTPLHDGESAPPPPVRVLDPADPAALELARLHDVLLSTHPEEIRTSRDFIECDLARDNGPDDREYWDENRRRFLAMRDAQFPRRKAYWALAHAVIAAHGGGLPWLSEWHRYGTAHRVVRVGDRIYSVCSDHDADWPDNGEEGDDDDGSVVLSVIDLGDAGGRRS